VTQAGGLLWQVSDHLQSQHSASLQGSNVQENQERETSSAESIEQARTGDTEALVGPTSPGPVSRYLELWMFLLQRLLELCSDRRQEARDGAIQILWRSIELYGHSLDSQAWETCLWKVIFPLFSSLDEGIKAAGNAPVDQTAVAAGKPSSSKQWDESKILAITSAGTVFADHLSSKMASLPSFEKVCSGIITYTRDSFLHGRPAVGTAAMKCLEKVCSVKWSTTEGTEGGQKKEAQARFIAEEAWKAWTDIGQQIVDHEKYDFTQQNLESYTKVVVTLQRAGHLAFGTRA